ncbi:hypothetical protein FA15DRAFT_591242 [Coprinopsis marcescibilis]|uniref:Uncharacterized protein n=1 Tax=Coprinopsis marcescibilis TaxID=230819 RepID=A0A5C3KX86_COPMA|nr:hypothetical protein FA15DRAFT_591242 [Coprinopsis marcescibilis]
MTRRAPPTALRLVSGPVPDRNAPKHRLPSLPRPIHTVATTRPIKGQGTEKNAPIPAIKRSESEDKQQVRGPWNHSSSISVVIDVSQLLAPPKPVLVKSWSSI